MRRERWTVGRSHRPDGNAGAPLPPQVVAAVHTGTTASPATRSATGDVVATATAAAMAVAVAPRKPRAQTVSSLPLRRALPAPPPSRAKRPGPPRRSPALL